MNLPTIRLTPEEEKNCQDFGLPIDPSEWNEASVGYAQSIIREFVKSEGNEWFHQKEGRHSLAEELTTWRGIQGLKNQGKKEVK